MEKRFISPRECAEYLGLKVDTIYTWAWARKIPSHKFGRLVRFDLREIEKWAKENAVAEIN